MINAKQKSVEEGLRFKVLFSNIPNATMNLLDRMEYYHVKGLSMAVIDNGKIDWIKSYGVADADAGSLVHNTSLFQAGSISKSITAFGIMYLVQQGILSLDEDVNKYLKSWHIPENEFTRLEKVTLRRILSHSAGLTVSGFPGYEIDASIPSIIEILDGNKPICNTDPVRVSCIPGTQFRYSGGGTTIAQLVIEDVTGESFHEWMQKNVLSKIGMDSSTFNQLPHNLDVLTSGHNFQGKCVKGKHHIYPEMAAAGLWSNANDIANFVIYIQNAISGIDSHFLNKALVNDMLTAQVRAPRMDQPGLGLFLKHVENDVIFEHGGQDHGFIALYRGFTEKKSGFAIMMNAAANGWYLMEELSNSIADVYQWKEFLPVYRSVKQDDPSSYNRLKGIYKLKETDGTIEIQTDNNKLFLKENAEMPRIELHFTDDNLYFTQEGNHEIKFKDDNTFIMKDNNGEVHTYHFSEGMES